MTAQPNRGVEWTRELADAATRDYIARHRAASEAAATSRAPIAQPMHRLGCYWYVGRSCNCAGGAR